MVGVGSAATPQRRSRRLQSRGDNDTESKSGIPLATSPEPRISRRASKTVADSTSSSKKSAGTDTIPPHPSSSRAARPSRTDSLPSKKLKRSDCPPETTDAPRVVSAPPVLPPLSLPDRPYSLHALPESVLMNMSPHERARRLLHVGATPASLPCREEQFQAVLDCTADALRAGTGGCAYVCGVPGTGKTATVRETIRVLQGMRDRGDVPKFTFVEINGMKLASPMQAYTELWCGINGGGRRLHPRSALSKLTAYFNVAPGTNKMPTVVLIDELDLFVTSRQDVIYNMFHWPNLPGSNLIVIAVANTMDLPERTLQPKVASRLGMTRIPFMPYTDRHLLDIVRARLDVDAQGERQGQSPATVGCEAIFKLDALIFASKRVANVSGDARRMLDVCRRAVEMAEERALAQNVAPSPLTIHDIRDVMDRMARSGRAAHIAALSIHAKLLLASMYACLRRTGIHEVVWSDVVAHHAALCRTHAGGDTNVTEVSGDDLQRPLASLCSLGLVIAVGAGAGSARGGSHARFLLAVQEDEVHTALGENDERWQSLFLRR